MPWGPIGGKTSSDSEGEVKRRHVLNRDRAIAHCCSSALSEVDLVIDELVLDNKHEFMEVKPIVGFDEKASKRSLQSIAVRSAISKRQQRK